MDSGGLIGYYRIMSKSLINIKNMIGGAQCYETVRHIEPSLKMPTSSVISGVGRCRQNPTKKSILSDWWPVLFHVIVDGLSAVMCEKALLLFFHYAVSDGRYQ